MKARPFFGVLLGSLLAGFFTLAAFVLANHLQDGLLVAATGASAYIVFLLPQSKAAATANVLGGYGLGIVAGLLCAWLGRLSGAAAAHMLFDYLLPVFLTAMAMRHWQLDHPPAVAMAISIAVAASPLVMALVSLLIGLMMVLGKKLYLLFPRHDRRAASKTDSLPALRNR